jgi:methylphosphotriester-DNA--protein-cysteine methyltransferase
MYSAVITTGIYCRPGCGAKPLAENVLIFELAAAAEAAGFRACYRCRPYRVAGPVAASAPQLVCQVVQLIIDGALDDGGTEAGLADRVGMSARHLRRLFLAHLGATPDQLARSRRAHFARRLLDDTDLPAIDVAFASGFGSLRQFNRAMQEVFRASPTDLRSRRHRVDRLVADGGLALRLRSPALLGGPDPRREPGRKAPVDSIVYDAVLEETGTSAVYEKWIGRVRIVEGAAFASSALIGGVIAGAASPRVTYFLTVPVVLASIVAFLRFDEPQLHRAAEHPALRQHVATTFTAMTRIPRVRQVMLLAALTPCCPRQCSSSGRSG